MIQTKDAHKVAALLAEAQCIVIIQADNPDADSLASALALEHILGDQQKDITLYCGVDMPSYLKYIPGSDRIVNQLPNTFDLSIIVDCSTVTLLQKLEESKRLGTLKNRPCLVLDHHISDADLPFEYTLLSHPEAVSTGELIFELSQKLKWDLSTETGELLAISILADSLGLTTENVTANSIRVLASLVDKGVNLAQLDARRRVGMTKPREIISYKAKLLERIEYYNDSRLAIVDIPWKEIEQYSAIYNPGVLALEELRFAEGVQISVALKSYPDGKITGKLRCNFGSNIAGNLAAHFGGGGHAAASGFKIFGWNLQDVKKELISQSLILLDAEQANNP